MDGTETKRDTGATHSAGSGQAESLLAASAANQGTSEQPQTFTRAGIDKAINDALATASSVIQQRAVAAMDGKAGDKIAAYFVSVNTKIQPSSTR